MKFKIALILLIVTLNAVAQEKQVKLYPFKSAVIEYKYEASAKGTHIKYIDDWGYKQADYIYKQLNFGGNNDKEYEIIIITGQKAYTIDLQEKEVAIGRNVTYNYFIENNNQKCTDISDALVKAEGFSLAGTEVFLGKECKLWKSKKATKLTWNGVVLKSEINFLTMMVEKATSIKIDIEIPSSKFDIPQNVKYISSDTYQGYSGLKLNFSNSKKSSLAKPDNIRVEFNSADLEQCNNFDYFLANGTKIAINGDNDYNKIDNRLIKSQQNYMLKKPLSLPHYATVIFKTSSGEFGKMQIKKIDKNGFELRYVLFNTDGLIKEYSQSTKKILKNSFKIEKENSNYKIKLTPINNAKCLVLGW
jgi:hypothetical protein